MFPVFDRTMQIPTARLQVGFRIEKLLHVEIVDLVFARPFVSRFFTYLHKHERSMRKPKYIRVVVDRAIHRELDYAVPEELAERIGVGSRVRVPFRDKSALATVVGVLEHSEAKGIRPIEAIIGDAPILSEQLLELARWISAYYCCPI